MKDDKVSFVTGLGHSLPIMFFIHRNAIVFAFERAMKKFELDMPLVWRGTEDDLELFYFDGSPTGVKVQRRAIKDGDIRTSTTDSTIVVKVEAT